jgi:lipid-binding SYLF domain-containing protein
MKPSLALLLPLLGLFALNTSLFADDDDMREAVHRGAHILREKQVSPFPIPAAVLNHAQAVGIIEVTKGAVGVGGASGEGIIVERTPTGWSAPFAFTQGGGSVGFQIGVDIKRYIYVFNSRSAMRPFTGEQRGRFQADAGATSGPTSASEIAANGLPESPMFIYTLSDGAYAGASIGGQVVGGSPDTNRDAYGIADPAAILRGKVPVPAYADHLLRLLPPPAGAVPVAPATPVAPAAPVKPRAGL